MTPNCGTVEKDEKFAVLVGSCPHGPCLEEEGFCQALLTTVLSIGSQFISPTHLSKSFFHASGPGFLTLLT